MTGPTFVQVNLGPSFPGFIWDSLRQIRMFNPGARVILLVNRGQEGVSEERAESLEVKVHYYEELSKSDDHRTFLKKSRLDRRFRDGFWIFASERFFVLEAMMRELGLDEIFHLENDVLLYADLCDLLPVFRAAYRHFAATFDTDERCVPGFVYVSDPESLTRYTSLLVTDRRNRKNNDMKSLGLYRREHGDEWCTPLPVVPEGYEEDFPMVNLLGGRPADPKIFSAHAAELRGIFDAAALGQFTAGIDPRNSPGQSVGFVNESAYYDPRNLPIRWERDDRGRLRPSVVFRGSPVRLYSLHIHSKELWKYGSWSTSLVEKDG
jgi:hypothetical protein